VHTKIHGIPSLTPVGKTTFWFGMSKTAANKRIPAWLRSLCWLCFILLGLATPLLMMRRLMESSHQTAVALVKPGRALPKSSSKNSVAASFVQKDSTTSRGIPMAELPLVGVYAGDDLAARKELEKQLEEIRNLMRSLAGNSGIDCRVDGVLSFRAALAKMGMAVPETMTEAEAAAEFLKWAERFSDVLEQWREAVGKGSWDFSLLETKDSYATLNKIYNVATSLQRLLGAMAEARLRTGDADGAWADLQTMNSSGDRSGDMLVSPMFWLWPEIFQTAHAGMKLDVWTDTQLMGISTMMGEENALASMRREMDRQKLGMADYLTHFREHQSEIQEDFSRSESSIDQMINRFGIATATDQQIADNLAVIEYQRDQPFTRFDPDTGVFLGESAGDIRELPHSKPSDVSFDKFYYMYSEMYGGRHDWVPEQIIRSQSAIDQTRIAAALEIQQRASGEYPETLDAVSGTFGGSTPIDIATGQPYLYQRNADGGYTLWGTGIDGKSEGGNEKTDVTWTHRPVKGR
jgi:hypothetical protein